ncbi:hypothetical protein PENSPDRAFT_14787 [Peniophora sp. CONT]|nr:hypothetical protein PENSPDRAFT_14787 [Peniophora sp. CONT]
MVSVKAALFNLGLLGGVLAQDLSIPALWQGTKSPLSRSQRDGIAHDAAASLASSLNYYQDVVSGLSTTHLIASQFAVLALQDWLSGNTSWENQVKSPSQDWTQANGFFHDDTPGWDEPIYWSIVYFYAYRAYGLDPGLLSSAISAWQYVYDNAFISEADVANGAGAGTAGRTFPYALPADCFSNATIAGGVFYYKNRTSDTTINSESVGPFMAVSAYLYEATSNATYLSAAQLSLDFMLNYLWNGTIVYDSFVTDSCSIPTKSAVLSYDQAWFIEGLSVMANITKNDTLTALLLKAVPSVITVPKWTDQSGVITEGDNATQANLKSIFVRGLAEARRRNPGTPLANYIEAYITVQVQQVPSIILHRLLTHI